MINWKKSTWKREITIYDDELAVGKIVFDKMWGYNSKIQWNNLHFSTEVQGFWQRKILFFCEDYVDRPLYATLSLNTWRNGGKIELRDKEVYHWSYDNFWHTRWKVTNQYKEVLIKFQDRTTLAMKGEVYNYLEDTLNSENADTLVIVGLFASYLYRESAASAGATS